MSKDHSERRTYRKSPGRQYGYDYDPLRSHSGQSQSGQAERWSSNGGETGSRSGALLAQRPDPRRTRQLLRKSIIASKTPTPEDETDELEYEEKEQNASYQHIQHDEYTEESLRRPYLNRGARAQRTELVEEDTPQKNASARSGRLTPAYRPSSRKLLEVEQQEQDQWEDIDPSLEYEDPFDMRPGYGAEPIEIERKPASVRPRSQTKLPPMNRDIEEDELFIADDEGDQRSPVGRLTKKRKLSRRGILFGAGAIAVGAAGIAVIEMAPKVPQVVGNAEHQIQAAFEQGVAQGANDARKELLNTLDTLGGFTVDGAIAAAGLTRVAYDVFVSPIVKYGAVLAVDFLTAMLNAFTTGRKWLQAIQQDNATLQAIQNVLQSWVTQISTLPKQLDTVTQTDLDGAQAYLRELKRTLADEQTKLNSSLTPTPTKKVTPSATQPTQKSTQ